MIARRRGIGVCGYSCDGGLLLCWRPHERLLTFQSAGRDVPSSQNMPVSFTNVCSVGAVSTVTSEMVELLGGDTEC